jgi:hypothetical protein
MGTLSQVLEIIFEMKRKMSDEKITRREINVPTYNTSSLKKSFFGPLLLSNLITFLFLFILNDLKCNRSTT